MKNLPEEIGNLNKLKRIRIEENLLERLPRTLLELDDLEELSIDSNLQSESDKDLLNQLNARGCRIELNDTDTDEGD